MRSGGVGRIRIVAGSHRGRFINVPNDPGVRPTSDKVREAIFDVLGPVDGLEVLDLFGGTGALGLEALSRGAERCVFVETSPQASAVLKENITTLGYERVSRLIMTDYRRALDALSRGGERFDLLFVDPPYRMLAEVENALTPVLSSLLSVKGLVVVEGPRSDDVSLGLETVFERIYGDTKITMVRVKE